jgi:hypothetical protein
VTSNGIPFLPNFVKIGKLVEKLEREHRQRGELIHLLTVLGDFVA